MAGRQLAVGPHRRVRSRVRCARRASSGRQRDDAETSFRLEHLTPRTASHGTRTDAPPTCARRSRWRGWCASGSRGSATSRSATDKGLAGRLLDRAPGSRCCTCGAGTRAPRVPGRGRALVQHQPEERLWSTTCVTTRRRCSRSTPMAVRRLATPRPRISRKAESRIALKVVAPEQCPVLAPVGTLTAEAAERAIDLGKSRPIGGAARGPRSAGQARARCSARIPRSRIRPDFAL